MPEAQDLSEFREIATDTWKDSHPRDRHIALQGVENRLAQAQNRPACIVETYPSSNSSELGKFAPKQSGYVYVNQDLLFHDSPSDTVHTVAHEGRHAYQHHCISNPEQHPEVSTEQRKEWQENFRKENYVPPTADYDSYRAQPVERDANNYADNVVHETYKETEKTKQEDKSADTESKKEGKLAKFKAKYFGTSSSPSREAPEAEPEQER